MHKTKDYIMRTIAWMIVAATAVVMTLSVIALVQKDTRYRDLAAACTKLGGIPIEQYPTGILCLDIIVLKSPQ